ncbi:MAG: hypothetical protein COW59_11905 [Lysobacterales bacterium CG17_big_fil_post_rev_8_21_14_2_50_64_11]|nr:MAG: hypothetical protein COW59_11905 [Xanthomonadales bacterium CG17_big_fil_post_rev_8_21_14_2_50_64_11]
MSFGWLGKTLLIAALALAVLGSPLPAAAGDALKADHRGLRYRSPQGDVRLAFGGRVHYDAAWFDDDVTPISDDADFRRLRLALSGRIGDDFSFKAENDIGGTSRGWKNLWLAYGGIKHLRLTAGNLVAPLSMEQQQSSNTLPLMERSLMSALTPGFLAGVQGRYSRAAWTVSLGYFTDPIDDVFGQNNASGHGPVARLTFAPIERRFRTLHFGVSLQQRSLDAGSQLRLRTRPESGLADAALLNSGAMRNADSFVAYGLEGLWRYRSLWAQAEYVHMDVDRHAAGNVQFAGSYLQAGYVLTGEKRRYARASGLLGGLRPDSRWGALELVTRYSMLDLRDADISGGKGRDYSVGLNWYLNRNIGLSANYVRALLRPNRGGVDESVNVYQLRASVYF